MSVTRRAISDPAVRDAYVAGVLALKSEHLGPTTGQLGIPGPTAPVSTWDLFVAWHHRAMMTLTPPTQGDRNAAHSGPVFLPWHRFMMVLLELHMQRALGDDQFALPYWDWAADGDLPAGQQPIAPLWQPSGIGGSGSPVADGPFTPDTFRVRIESGANVDLRATDRGLNRDLASDIATLPTTAQVTRVIGAVRYDRVPWDRSPKGLRNRLEGWSPGTRPAMHNQVHVWVGGDMSPASSPNDPAFYLNHANVDRIWEAWMVGHGRVYLPGQDAAVDLAGHRIDDPMNSLLSAVTVRPRDVLDISAYYAYDTLPT